MASLGFSFDPNSVDTDKVRGEFSLLPRGIYGLEVDSAEVKATKSGTGTLLAVGMTVIEPEEYQGQRVFNNINLVNDSIKAQNAGREELGKLTRAVGITHEVEDSDELKFKAFVALVDIEPGNNGYKDKNKIEQYYFPDKGNLPLPGSEPPPPKPARQAAAPANDNRPAARPAAAANDNRPQAKPAGSRPWDRKAA